MSVFTEVESSLIDKLPSSHGVYYFKNRKGEVIYIGKSINIRQRVRSHFAAAKRDAKERKLATLTVSIDTQETSGELSALLLESFEIKRVLPIYNRRLRRRSKQYAWQLTADKTVNSGFLRPQIADELWPPQVSVPQFGSFRNLAQARKFLGYVTKEYQLCAKVLGMEMSGQSCFAFQLKQCQGACVGKETADSHNQRLREALSTHCLDTWPFNGVIGVVELAAPEEVIVFDAWRYLGVYDRTHLANAADRNELDRLFHSNSAHVLDRDSYKILLSFLKHKRDDIQLLDFSFK